MANAKPRILFLDIETKPAFVEWADAKGGAELQYITWFGLAPNEVILDYGDAGSIKAKIKGRAA